MRAVVHWWIHWRSIDWNEGSHHVKHSIVALICDPRMYKPTTLQQQHVYLHKPVPAMLYTFMPWCRGISCSIKCSDSQLYTSSILGIQFIIINYTTTVPGCSFIHSFYRSSKTDVGYARKITAFYLKFLKKQFKKAAQYINSIIHELQYDNHKTIYSQQGQDISCSPQWH